jgi:hypothetical protein
MTIRFVTGNVIRTAYNSIEIVVSVGKDGYTNTIPIDCENCNIGHRYKTYDEEYFCECGSCDSCDNNEPITKTIYGMDKAVLLSPTIKDWIMKNLTNNFGF